MDQQDADKLLAPVQDLLDRLGVEHVFGAPVQEGDSTVIPVADVMLGFGYGMGEGTAPGAAGEGEEPGAPAGGGSGGGAGAGGRATPRGYIRVSSSGVTYEPIVDQERLAVAGMLLGGWVVFWVARTLRAFAGK